MHFFAYLLLVDHPLKLLQCRLDSVPFCPQFTLQLPVVCWPLVQIQRHLFLYVVIREERVSVMNLGLERVKYAIFQLKVVLIYFKVGGSG